MQLLLFAGVIVIVKGWRFKTVSKLTKHKRNRLFVFFWLFYLLEDGGGRQLRWMVAAVIGEINMPGFKGLAPILKNSFRAVFY
ncbi:MAG: hypothetical protein ACI9FJ_003078 [Alteromonadaceae bacterium]|jgi:hypothetical protein